MFTFFVQIKLYPSIYKYGNEETLSRERKKNTSYSENSSHLSSSLAANAVVNCKPAKELRFWLWIGLGVDPVVQTLKCQFPRGIGRSQTPRCHQGGRALCSHVSAGVARLSRTPRRVLREPVDTRACTSCSRRARLVGCCSRLCAHPLVPPALAGRAGGRTPCAHVAHFVQHGCYTFAGGGAPPVRRCRGGDAVADLNS
ncbi:hypothetical protein F511_27018 [Dorcoceras hygrometricum]|uniref:Uncharacterized protein n=1 Tax=Dorcoceras hygrometricum TaxID=472368 RepID=A0A2Z7DAI4_9LAMI|nr:hypothetical protein F511_27018 [Dorcoceras hygrometricum]